MDKKLKDLFLFVCIGFFIIFFMSLAFPHDICGEGRINSSPRIFFGFAVFWLIVFYFINRKIKNFWLFSLATMFVGFCFEFFFVEKFLRIEQTTGWIAWLGMAVYWGIWLGATNKILKKIDL